MTTMWMLMVVYLKSGDVLGNDTSYFKTYQACEQRELWLNGKPEFVMLGKVASRRAICQKVAVEERPQD